MHEMETKCKYESSTHKKALRAVFGLLEALNGNTIIFFLNLYRYWRERWKNLC